MRTDRIKDTHSNEDVYSMSAAKSCCEKPTNNVLLPSAQRDGFHLVPNHPIVYDTHIATNTGISTYQGDVFQDITYKISTEDRCARIAFNRPDVLHAFRPTTINEIRRALDMATDDTRIAVILIDSETDSSTDLNSNSNVSHSGPFTPAFCAGGDQTVRSDDGGGGYHDGSENVPRLRVLDLQVQMRRCPKPILAIVRGYAIGGGHILHMVADITIASTHAVFGQTGPRMGSFDAGYGSVHMARLIGQKKAREMWFTCKFYDAHEAKRMGLINEVFTPEELDGEVGRWVRRIAHNSPTALACTKAALNADQDGAAGIALMGGHLTRLFYMSEESKEGQRAFLEKRAPKFHDIPQSRL